MQSSKKYKLSDKTVEQLIVFGGGHFSPKVIDQLVKRFNDEIERHYFSAKSEVNLNRIIAAQFDKISFLLDCIKYPHHIEIIVAIAVHSNYLTDVVVMNPGYLYQVFNPDYLYKTTDNNLIEAEIETGLKGFNSFNAKLNFLKSYKRRATLKIGLRDILGLDNLKSTTLSISNLAKRICASLFELCFNEIKQKYKIENDEVIYVLSSLGKLGGNELNYSSDIDLMLFYDQNKLLNSPLKIEVHSLISESIQLFIQSSTENTGRGILYRIDFRLRPEGRYAPLCRSMSDYLKYYEIRGENWERQMLIKLNFVTGSRALFDSFQKFVTPFIYPSFFITSPLDEIRKLKKGIESNSKSESNIKLFHGGIRDIEFSIQALQLLNGGNNEDLRTGNTLEAIEQLFSAGLLNSKESEKLTEAYIFYRKIEHYLQLMNDLQTHSIPSDGEMLQQMARFFGFNTIKKFKNRIEKHRKSARDIFDSITLSSNTAGSDLQSLFENINFHQRERAISNFRYLKTGIGISTGEETDRITARNFDQIETELLAFCERSKFPDRVLENFAKIVKNIKFVSPWYSEFRNKNLFTDFLTVCERSQRAVDDISLDQFKGELFLSKKVFTKDVSELFSTLSIRQILFILTFQYTLNLINSEKFKKLLCDCVLHRINRTAKDSKLNYNFFIGGLGSFSTGEMIFSSDVDLIIVAEFGDAEAEIQNDFQKLLINLREELHPFKPDVRLRPEGKNSPLVMDLNNYKKYLNSRARVWEFQSLLKLKFVTGNINIYKDFKNIILQTVEKLDQSVIKKEIKEMNELITKQRISQISDLIELKTGRGGIIQIEFFLDSFILSDRKLYSKNLGSSINSKIDFISKHGNDIKKIEKLKSNLKILQDIELAMQNILNKNMTRLPENVEELRLLEEFTTDFGTEDIEKFVKNIMQENSDIMKNIGMDQIQLKPN